MEDSLALVQPQLGKHMTVWYGCCLGHKDTLEHLSHVSHVKQVVESARNWKHVLVELGEHIDSGTNSYISTSTNPFREHVFAQEFPYDGVKYLPKDFFGSVRNRKDLEMPHKSWSQWGTTTPRWCSCTHQSIIINSLLKEHWSIIYYATIHQQPQELNWRLCTIAFNLWHVDVVDEDEALLTTLGTNDFLAPLFSQR